MTECIGNAVAKGSQPLALAWSALTQAESKIQEFNGTGASIPVELPMPDGSTLNLTEIVKYLDLSLQLFWHCQCSDCPEA